MECAICVARSTEFSLSIRRHATSSIEHTAVTGINLHRDPNPLTQKRWRTLVDKLRTDGYQDVVALSSTAQAIQQQFLAA